MTNKTIDTFIERLALLAAFCAAAEILRMLISGNTTYVFMNWNLLLAWAPLYCAMQLHKTNGRWRIAALLLTWLALFPNAPYMITDLLHLKPHDNCPFWFDIMLLFAFALAGLLPGLLSAWLVFKRLQSAHPLLARAFIAVAMLLSGYGVYIGRFLRYNSWDIITNPAALASDTFLRLTNPFTYPRTYGVSLMAGVLVYLLYLVFEPLLQPAYNQKPLNNQL